MNRQEKRAIRSMTAHELKGLVGLERHIVEQTIAWLMESDPEFRFDEPGFDDALAACNDRLSRILEDSYDDFVSDIMDLSCTRSILDIEQPTELSLMAIPMMGSVREMEMFVADPKRLRSFESSIRESEFMGPGVVVEVTDRLLHLENASALRPGLADRAMNELVHGWRENRQSMADEAAEIVGGYRPAPESFAAEGVLAPRLLLVAVLDKHSYPESGEEAAAWPSEDELFLSQIRWLERVSELVPLVEFGSPQAIVDAVDEALAFRFSQMINIELLTSGIDSEHQFQHAHVHWDKEARSMQVVLVDGDLVVGPLVGAITPHAAEIVLDDLESREADVVEHETFDSFASAIPQDGRSRPTN